jgi:hypothetical protein
MYPSFRLSRDRRRLKSRDGSRGVEGSVRNAREKAEITATRYRYHALLLREQLIATRAHRVPAPDILDVEGL